MVTTIERSIGQYAPDFELPGTDGAVHHLTHYLKIYRAVGVVVMGNHCPYVLRHLARLNALQDQLQAQGFTLVGINGNQSGTLSGSIYDESVDGMRRLVQTHRLTFPYLRDKTQDVLRTFGATMTPQFFLLDQAGIVRYDGPLMLHQHPQTAAPASIETAIAHVLSGQPVPASLLTPAIPAETSPTETSPIRWRV